MFKWVPEWMKAWPLALIVFCLLAFLVYLNERGSAKLQDAITFVSARFDFQAGSAEKTDNYTISFWTPSAETTAYWRSQIDSGNSVKDNDQWEVTAGNRVDDFAREISRLEGVLGFRRHDVVGKGRHMLKPGHWWIVTAKRDFQIGVLVKSYRDFWHCPDSVYAEVHIPTWAGYRYEDVSPSTEIPQKQ